MLSIHAQINDLLQSDVTMTDFTNPRGRILQTPNVNNIDHDQIVFETIGFGLAMLSDLNNYFSCPSTAAKRHAENPALDAFRGGILIGRCELNISVLMTSEFDEVEDDEIDEPHYHISFKDIRVEEDFRGEGIGRRLTACAARHAASVVAEDMLKRPECDINVYFHADLVSEAGEALYNQLMNSVIDQLGHFEDRFVNQIAFHDEGGW